MKKILILLLVIIFIFIFSPNIAEYYLKSKYNYDGEETYIIVLNYKSDYENSNFENKLVENLNGNQNIYARYIQFNDDIKTQSRMEEFAKIINADIIINGEIKRKTGDIEEIKTNIYIINNSAL